MGQIERQKVIDTVKNTRKFCDTDNIDDFYDLLIEAFDVLPSAQSEIIHCKDCKHFGVDRYKKLTWCSRINYGYGYQADDFCSKAERRTDE